MQKMMISKSEFMMFLKHPAWLWLKKYDKSKLPEPDEAMQALFDEGTLFESYAEKLFLPAPDHAGGQAGPNAVKIGYKTDSGEFSGNKYWAMPEATLEKLNGGAKVVLQGRIEAENVTAIFDVLEKDGDEYNLYEIKSSTKVKPEHVYDLGFQTFVLEKAGLKVKNIVVIHVNNEYVRRGEIDPEGISTKTTVTEEVHEVLPEVEVEIGKAFEVLKDSKNMPDISPRYLKGCPISEWLPIYEAVEGKTQKESILNLCLLKPDLVGTLKDQDIELIRDIPLDTKLTEKQRQQVVANKTGEREIKHEEIKEFLDSLEYPLHFFDFESLMSVIPPFDGTRPYQQVPFQYSLHVLSSPDAELVHKEYLHTDNTHPVPELLKHMQEDFEGRGSVISWSKKYEVARNAEMAEMYPEYEKFLLGINDRMVDLMDPFWKGWFVDKDFLGSASIKKVLPVLVPELSYKDLEINNGAQAQQVWMDVVLRGKRQSEKEKIMSAMKKYCALDTYSMFAILKYLEKLT